MPAVPVTKPELVKPARPPTRNGAAPTTTATTSSTKTSSQKPTPSIEPSAKQPELPYQNPGIPSRPNSTRQPHPIQPSQHKVGTIKPKTVTTPGHQSQSQSKPQPKPTPSSASPAQPRGTIPSTDRNIDKVVLGDICFRAWYPSYYPKDILFDLSSPAHTHPPHQPHHNDEGSKDGGKGGHHSHKHREPPPILDRLCVCPCCFKYSKELVSWWEHVRICEARAHVPGRKIYTHPKGQRTVLVPAPGTTAPVSKTMRGGKRNSVAAKMVEEVVRDEGEWSIWEVDGEKEGVSLSCLSLQLFTTTLTIWYLQLFCQNLSLFAKLFLDNKSVFFDVAGFNYFLLVYTPPPPRSPPAEFPPSPDPDAPFPSSSLSPRRHIVGFFSKEKMSWDNNNLACILIFPPWQRKGLGSLLMGVSYEISRREGVLGGPEKPISDLGKKGYKRFWGGEIARWLLSLELGEREGEETVVDAEECSKATWIAVEDCLAVLREMGAVEDAGRGVDPRRLREVKEGEGDEGEERELREVKEVKEVNMVRIDKEAVRKWVVAHRINLERTCDPEGFVEGYALKLSEDETED